MNHAIVNPPIDRHKPADPVKDVFVHITKETDAGIYVSGAKVVATSSALTHYNFLAQSSATVTEDPSLSVMFILPMNAPGMKMFCRTSYEQTAALAAHPFDYPLSSRFDENDAILVLDNVFVPWEDVLVLRDAAKILSFHPASGFMHGYCFQGCTRLAVKMDFLAGLKPDHALSEITYEIPIPTPEKIICVGVNFPDRNEEYKDGQAAPANPSLFVRFPRSFTGHDRPPESPQLDYEGEIVIVIGKGGRRIAEADALSHIAALSLCNEGTIRDWVRHAKFNVTRGKNFDRTGSIGPGSYPMQTKASSPTSSSKPASTAKYARATAPAA